MGVFFQILWHSQETSTLASIETILVILVKTKNLKLSLNIFVSLKANQRWIKNFHRVILREKRKREWLHQSCKYQVHKSKIASALEVIRTVPLTQILHNASTECRDHSVHSSMLPLPKINLLRPMELSVIYNI